MRMQRPTLATFLLLLCGPLMASAQDTLRPPLLRVVPEQDTVVTSSSAYRLSGSTRPGWQVALNDSALRVYPSGAFVGLLPLAVGENRFALRAWSGPSQTDSQVFFIVRRKPLETTPADTLAIEDLMLEPSAELWVRAGEAVIVRCKGTPGCAASFLQGRQMIELPPEQAQGLRGVYEGAFAVGGADTFRGTSVVVRLTAPDGRFVERPTGGTLSIVGKDGPLVGVTKGEKPFINYGLGGDRLGGAKMGFLVPGVRLAIDGRRGQQYRVALSPDLEAWIPVEQVDLLPPGTHPPFSLTGSWNVRGTTKEDIVSVELSEQLPFTSSVDLHPTRIHVDIHGAVSNTNWITQTLTAKEIGAVSYSVPARGVFRVTLELRHRQLWGYSIGYAGNALVISVRRPPEKRALRRLFIAVDAGHGGDNDGAIGSTGSKEKEVNLATALHLKRLLEEEGAKVMLTRSGDSSSNNMDRLKKVVGAGADLLISIHSNSIGNTSDPAKVLGVSTYYRYLWARPLSMAVLQEVLKTGVANFGNVGAFNFTLSGPTELPTVLVELAFMSHPEDEMKLMDDAFRREMAERILDGVEEFLDTCED
jgi:N-acetylmuramoyl-L-alanine amidase